MLSKTKQKRDCKSIGRTISRTKVIDCVGDLLTRLWNAWHSERHFVFTVGGERVNPALTIPCLLRLLYVIAKLLRHQTLGYSCSRVLKGVVYFLYIDAENLRQVYRCAIAANASLPNTKPVR
jgi:hypothetical protein